MSFSGRASQTEVVQLRCLEPDRATPQSKLIDA